MVKFVILCAFVAGIYADVKCTYPATGDETLENAVPIATFRTSGSDFVRPSWCITHCNDRKSIKAEMNFQPSNSSAPRYTVKSYRMTKANRVYTVTDAKGQKLDDDNSFCLDDSVAAAADTVFQNYTDVETISEALNYYINKPGWAYLVYQARTYAKIFPDRTTMRLILLVLALVVYLRAKSLKMRMRSSGLRAKMISSGQYRQYLVQNQQMRILNMRKRESERILDFDDEFYLVDVQVGTPGQNMSLVLDTGSSALWVIDDACISAACNGTCHGGPPKHKFKTSASKTFKKEKREFVMAFCEGYLATDVVSFAGLTIREQEFGVATGIAPFYGVQPMDGFFGLGWPDLAEEKVVPLMQNILDQLDKPLFTIWLERKKVSNSGSNGGMITFGDFDPEHCVAEVDYVKLSSLTYWQFPMTGFSVGTFSQSRTEQASEKDV
ncbi:unnamed protein product [Cylicocyclus nassatus]|uniref:Peptidase A1 domain-containing protein n=1 Tax=Cylicocyclus nassatus TaxID=53992 RepID=A0AA36GD45_CYLNA|nr:unnamed protein product [Cylicocyclus nassatus]